MTNKIFTRENILSIYTFFCDIPLHIASIPSPTIILVELSFLGGGDGGGGDKWKERGVYNYIR